MIIKKDKVDYSLYLVTNNELIPEGLNFFEQIEKALQNGVTVVQLREKDMDTGNFIKRAAELHKLTQKYNVPLIINDRVDVAMAIDAEGVHVGQDDMDPAAVRKMIGNDKILGLSTRNEEELLYALDSDILIDYVGIGAVFSTSTKNVKIPPLGIEGVKNLLELIQMRKPGLKSVLIGGLNKYNIPSTLSNCHYDGFNTSGIAVVSCIMAQRNAALESKETLDSINFGFNKLQCIEFPQNPRSSIVHFITNSVAKHFSANVCIAVGGSPIMSELSDEFSDFAGFPNEGLVLNTGTPDPKSIQIYKDAIKIYNHNMRPIVYDPVGCGATNARRQLTKELLSIGHFTVIKGNLAEMATIAGMEGSSMNGVDSNMELDIAKAVQVFRELALEKKSIIVVTGEVDIIVDGISLSNNIKPNAVTIKGGNKLMAEITASGCSLAGVIARYVSAVPYLSSFDATVKAVSLFKEAGFRAAAISRGPGSFMTNFFDELYELSKTNDFKNTIITSL
jgi:thiamine-phosphate diphosphorylase/hydroxyethylthiazole kinase